MAGGGPGGPAQKKGGRGGGGRGQGPPQGGGGGGRRPPAAKPGGVAPPARHNGGRYGGGEWGAGGGWGGGEGRHQQLVRRAVGFRGGVRGASRGGPSVILGEQGGIKGWSMVLMMGAVLPGGPAPVVGVGWGDPGATHQKALDAGAYGIICPMINNRAEAEKFVGSCRYAPLGYRSSGPIRAALYGGADYHMKANDIVLAFGMIETQEALDNLDEILSVKGLDAIYVGPSDLSISFGYNPGGDKPDEWMMAALKRSSTPASATRCSPASIAARRPMPRRRSRWASPLSRSAATPAS